MRYSFFIALLFVLAACQSSKKETTIDEQVLALAEKMRQQVAPDQRTALFTAQLSQSGQQLTIHGYTNFPAAKDTFLHELKQMGYSVVDSFRVLPDTAQLAGKTRGLVHLSACNIRSRPAHSAELSTQATLGTPLRVYERNGDWYRVQTPDDYFGWLDAGGFTPLTPKEWEEWQQSQRVIYMPDMGFALAEPRYGSRRVSDLIAGNILQLAETGTDFTQVRFPDGRLAYIPTNELMPYQAWLATRTPNPENILSTAADHLGRPYLWGGTSGKAMDCSGFTKTVFYLNGLLLPRDASQQVHVGQEIAADTSLANLVPGDLLFFGRAATAQRPEKITHVAIYQGNGKIIHASERVRIQSLRPGDPDFAPERLATFVRARRVLEEAGDFGVPFLRDVPWYRVDTD